MIKHGNFDLAILNLIFFKAIWNESAKLPTNILWLHFKCVISTILKMLSDIFLKWMYLLKKHNLLLCGIVWLLKLKYDGCRWSSQGGWNMKNLNISDNGPTIFLLQIWLIFELIIFLISELKYFCCRCGSQRGGGGGRCCEAALRDQPEQSGRSH